MQTLAKTRTGIVIVGLLCALPALADTRFTARRMNRNDVPAGKGQCDIRLQVDDQVEVSVQADRVNVRRISGQESRDDGSECNQPMPDNPQGFTFEVKDSRNEIRMIEEPSRRNGGRALVMIRDTGGGFGRYHFRLSWQLAGYVPERGPDRRDDRGPDVGRDGGRDGGRVGEVRIVSAFWGVPGRGRDVTRLVQDRMRNGRLRIVASNEEMGFDPAVGVVKELFVVYEIRGRRQEVRVRENDPLELP